MTNFKYQIFLWFGILSFIIFFSYLSIRRYRTLNSYYYDLGIMNQVVYNTSQGRFLEMTNQDLKQNVSRLAIHFDPILAVFAPFYKIYEGPEVLLICQVLVVGLGAWAIFLIAEKVLKKKLISLIFAVNYLFYFAVQRAVLFDFHAVTLATTFLLFALYFNLVKKNKLYFIFVLLSLLTKEHIGLVVFLLGLYLFFIKKEKKTGLITSFLGLVFFIITVYFLIPYFRGSEHFALKYFVDIQLRYKEIIANGFSYIKFLMTPVFYSFFSPLSLAISLPEWAINILSINSNQRSILFHYNSVIVSFIFYSLILGYKNFDKLVKNRLIKNLVFILFIILNLKSIYLYNPVPYFVRHPVNYQNLNSVTEKSIKAWQEKLKNENIKVSTTPKLAPFFTKRKYYYNFLYDSAFANMGITEEEVIKNEINKYRLADYVIINKQEVEGELANKFYSKLINDKEYKAVFSDNQKIEVYRKI
ncbi:MAG: DUF2079 domain-containing protein [Candidatus Roizmanbacteria bacterium]